MAWEMQGKSIPHNGILLVLGDFNATVGVRHRE